MSDLLMLKWGTWKGHRAESEGFVAALNKYFAAGPQSCSAMMQEDTSEQKQALCDVIDACDGEICNWTGESYTKEQAKEYVLGYGQTQTSRSPPDDVATPAEIAATKEG